MLKVDGREMGLEFAWWVMVGKEVFTVLGGVVYWMLIEVVNRGRFRGLGWLTVLRGVGRKVGGNK